MKHLDRYSEMKKLDPKNVLGSTELFADQLSEAWRQGSAVEFPSAYRQVQNVVICGMGGSRFTPLAIKEVFRSRLTKPVEIVEDPILPGYVGKNTLVILSSYSGTTAEVISCARQAREKNAFLSGITIGGEIARMLKNWHAPFLQFDPVSNPSGQPRIGGGYLLMGHTALFHMLGIYTADKREIEEAIEETRRYSEMVGKSSKESNNEAKRLARALYETQPFIVTSQHLRGLGNGFANQLNETAKIISSYRYIPELNHHLMEGLMRPESLKKDALFLFLLSDHYDPSTRLRYAITDRVVRKQNIRTLTLNLKGKTVLSELLKGFVLSYFTTFYLAMLYDTDPASIPWVDFFKSELEKQA